MERLIYADSLLKKIHDTAEGLADCDQQNATWALQKYAVRYIMDAETVDAVEVVRCRDCSVPHNKYTGCPKLNGLVTTPDFYCPFGKRKDGDGNG